MFFVCILIAKRTPKLRVTTEIFHLGHGGTKPTIQYSESKGLVGEKPRFSLMAISLRALGIEEIGVSTPSHPGLVKVLASVQFPRSRIQDQVSPK